MTIRHGIDLPTEAQVAARLAWATPLRLLYAGRLNDEQIGLSQPAAGAAFGLGAYGVHDERCVLQVVRQRELLDDTLTSKIDK